MTDQSTDRPDQDDALDLAIRAAFTARDRRRATDWPTHRARARTRRRRSRARGGAQC